MIIGVLRGFFFFSFGYIVGNKHFRIIKEM